MQLPPSAYPWFYNLDSIKKMNVIPRRWLCEGSWESRNLLCRRTEATPQFKDCESMPNLTLSLGYHDFKTGVYNFLYELRLGVNLSIEKGRLSMVWVVGPLCLTYDQLGIPF